MKYTVKHFIMRARRLHLEILISLFLIFHFKIGFDAHEYYTRLSDKNCNKNYFSLGLKESFQTKK